MINILKTLTVLGCHSDYLSDVLLCEIVDTPQVDKCLPFCRIVTRLNLIDVDPYTKS